MSRLLPARFLGRPNRFIVEAELEDGGQRVRAHLADPGRLRELLLPGAVLRLRPAPPGGVRRTRYSVALVRSPTLPRVWVSLDTTLPNRLAQELLEQGAVHGLGRPGRLRREVMVGRSRFDFELEPRLGPRLLVEVKSVTLVEDGVARFPDAPTVRGTRHVRELQQVAAAGGRAAVLFIVQRPDACRVEPHGRTDPDFAAALVAAQRAGVLLRAAHYRLDAGGQAKWLGALPVRATAGLR